MFLVLFFALVAGFLLLFAGLLLLRLLLTRPRLILGSVALAVLCGWLLLPPG